MTRRPLSILVTSEPTAVELLYITGTLNEVINTHLAYWLVSSLGTNVA
jgi:hypothetical protein